MNVNIEANGLREMEQFLKTLPDAVSRQMLYGALMGAAMPIMKQARENVLRNFGRSARYTYTLEEAMVRGRSKKTGLAARVNVMIKKGKVKGKTVKSGVPKPYGDDAFYGRFLEFGTSKMSAKPFLRPAADSMGSEAVKRFNNTMNKRMAKWCKEHGVKYSPGMGSIT
ncbi:HK97 gp10 family phage protein [Paraburkholderia sp. UCT70]|uniref:HK97-gp10 family putative phage morphogenesis protein n=1 Tax=Paraburkholderia sp. UCT70 TaxID=2991068 RepID=UPI003D1DB797